MPLGVVAGALILSPANEFLDRYWANCMLPGFFIGLVLVGGMTAADANLFLYSFIGLYSFSRMMESVTRITLSLGFYGGIALLGWVYQKFFMPETKNKSLEEIDELFSLQTSVLVKRDMKQTAQVIRNLSRFHLRVFSSEPHK
ncbi:hypothetical protein PENANT_c008G05639 [Penicillium antarcticum]|uniref:Major facilitator superfamily (MFS) profile domain-containing protein n=2 Tax=Penicillium antarcticum TaxID=416450 RepID=A0A1V6QAN8_9EURO|nr:hypothetical protein PENANT_c008G05639 [Penicillium antarcticum]